MESSVNLCFNYLLHFEIFVKKVIIFTCNSLDILNVLK